MKKNVFENSERRFESFPGEYKFQINGKTENLVENMKERTNRDLSEALEKYIPIGSIVKIGDSFKKYMIVGFNKEMQNNIYDYIACEYPFGIDGKHELNCFNHEQIERVFYIGFVNNQQKSFKEELLNGNEGR